MHWMLFKVSTILRLIYPLLTERGEKMQVVALQVRERKQPLEIQEQEVTDKRNQAHKWTV